MYNKMKKIITAIGNNIVSDNLIKSENYKILSKDIQYREGVLEFLNEVKDVDILIISEILDGEIEFKKLISKILKINEKIEIIVFVEDYNKDLNNFLNEKGIYKIYKNNELTLEELNEILESENSQRTQELAAEIRKLKKIINEQNYNLNQNNNEGKIIAITGNSGVGKSTISCIICKNSYKSKKKTLIIDFDIYNKSIPVLYNVFSKYIDYENIKNNIINVSKYEDLLYVEQEFFDNFELIELIKNLKNEYDQILIDTSSNVKSKFYKEILEISDYIVFVVVPTLCDLKKAINMFEILKMDFKIPIEKIKLIINKENNYSVDSFIIQKMFGIKVISGELKYIESFENFLNGKIKKKMKINL